MTTKKAEKQRLRQCIKAKVAEISMENRISQSQWITTQVLQLEEFQKAEYLGKVNPDNNGSLSNFILTI